MNDKNINSVANKLVKAFLNNKIISSIPSRYSKKMLQADKLRKLCEKRSYALSFPLYQKRHHRTPPFLKYGVHTF